MLLESHLPQIHLLSSNKRSFVSVVKSTVSARSNFINLPKEAICTEEPTLSPNVMISNLFNYGLLLWQIVLELVGLSASNGAISVFLLMFVVCTY